MATIKTVGFLFFLLGIVAIASISTVSADTYVNGTISEDTTWDLAGSPYIVDGNVYVKGTDGPDGATALTIEPGVVVMFNPYTRLEIGSDSASAPGALIADGTRRWSGGYVASIQFFGQYSEWWGLSTVGSNLTISITSIYRYNSSTGLFEKCDHLDNWGWWQATGSESFTELEPGGGYWVMAKNDCNLTFTGTEPSDLNVTLNKSWNLVGWYSISEALLGKESLVGNPLNVTLKNSLTSIYRYNSSTGLFEKCDHFDDWGWWAATGSENFTKLEPGRGYWVMAKNECEWQHEI